MRRGLTELQDQEVFIPPGSAIKRTTIPIILMPACGRLENPASLQFDGNEVALSAQLRNRVLLAGILALSTEAV
jgi:hypothetical protein